MRTAICIALLLIQWSHGQTSTSNIIDGVQLIDFHYSNVTDIQYITERNEIYSSDASGKIIVYDGTSQKYKFTFQKADGVAVHKMQLLNKNRLILHKAYATMDGTKPDSLLTYDIPNTQKISSQAFKGKLLGNDIDDYASFSISKGYEHGLVIMKRDPFNPVGTVMSNAPATTASVSINGKQIAFVEAQYGTASFVVKATDNSELFREDLSELIGQMSGFKVIYEDTGSILLIVNDTSAKSTSVYRYSIDFKRELVKKLNSNPGFGLITESVIRNGKKEFFFGTDTNSYQNEYVKGIMNEGIYSIDSFETDKNFSYAYLNSTSNDVSFFSLFGDLSSISKPITRYQIISNKKVDIDGTAAFGDYEGTFLASGDLIFIGNSGNEKEEIKLFTAGTLQNKFAPLGARAYLKRDHELDLFDYSFINEQIDPLSSSMAVLADYKGKRRIVSYNFSTEKVGKLSENISDGFTSVVSYHGKTSQVILSKGSYKYGGGYVDPGSLKWCVAGDCKMIKGSYKYAQFSRDGTLLLTVNNKSLIELRALPSLKVLTAKQIEGAPKVDLNYSDNNEFEIALNYTYLQDACYLKHISLVISGTDYDFQERDCLGVLDADFQNGTQAALLNFVGVLVGDQLLKTDKSSEPASISLNTDGSKLLVNYKHGLIELFDVASNQKDLSIIQPDYDSHLFVDRQGNYIANFKAEDLVIGYQNGKETSLNILKSSFYKPSLILEKLGPVDAAYAKTLAKAEQIRDSFSSQDNSSSVEISDFQLNNGSSYSTTDLVNTFSFQSEGMDKNDVVVYLNGVEVQEAKIKTKGSNGFQFEIELAAVENAIELKTKSGTVLVSQSVTYEGSALKPNLYVLAVGVSNYQQSKYNLTFAAKDALDIAQLYGNLSEKEVRDYQNEYYGDPLFVTRNDGSSVGVEGFYYEENMFGNSNFIPASYTGTLWIELAYNKAYLHNFETGERKDLDYDTFGDLTYSPVYILDPDEEKFIFLRNEKWYSYDIEKNALIDYSIPISEDVLNSGQYRYLENNNWIEFISESKWDEGSIDQVTITTTHKGKVLKTSVLELKETYNPSLKAVSNDGRYVLIKAGENDFYLYDLGDQKPRLISNSKIDGDLTLDQFYIKGDDKPVIYRSIDRFDEMERFTSIITYDENLEELDENKWDLSLDYGRLQVVIGDQGPLYLNRTKSSATDRQILTKSIEDLVKNRSATAASFENTQVTYLLNEDANKKNILKEIQSLRDKVRPQDQVVVFIAGHGVLDKGLNYYYAPNDMNFDNVQENGVSFNEIIQGLNDTRSTKMLLLMDTCHSGNTLDMEGYEIVEESVEDKDGNKKRGGVAATTSNKGDTTTVSQVVSTLFDNFTSVSGVTVISASSGQDVAYESDELSNGAFTTAYISYLQEQLGQGFTTQADFSKPLNLTDDFIKQLRQRILDYTNDKQQLDIREINELSKIKVW
ncbi:MAG: caspase family protein [Nonlabens sp.]|uniref:caspase family protein n=1 Tax=Nonlabens sp. TaxID=1888209 RepID=UPI003EF58039